MLLLTQSGCLTTIMWLGATDSEARLSHVNVIKPPAADQTPPGIVATYRLDGVRGVEAKYFRFVIPIDAAGRPAWPLAVAGNPVNERQIVAAVPEAQAKAIRLFAFTSAAFRAGKKLPADRADGVESYSKFAIQIDTLHCYAFGLDDVGNFVAATAPDEDLTVENGGRKALEFPPGTRIVLIPEEQMRPGSDQARGVAGAVILTPFTLAIDTVLTPAFFVMVLFTGFPC